MTVYIKSWDQKMLLTNRVESVSGKEAGGFSEE